MWIDCQFKNCFRIRIVILLFSMQTYNIYKLYKPKMTKLGQGVGVRAHYPRLYLRPFRQLHFRPEYTSSKTLRSAKWYKAGIIYAEMSSWTSSTWHLRERRKQFRTKYAKRKYFWIFILMIRKYWQAVWGAKGYAP